MGDLVKAIARELAAERGGEFLGQVAKTHFKTAAEVAPQHFTNPPLPEGHARAK